jgi:hypothetical protein
MTTEEDFKAYVDALSNDEQEALGASLFLASTALIGADNDMTLRELLAMAKGLMAGSDALGPGFEPLISRGKIGAEQHKITLERELADLRQKLKQGLSAPELDAMKAKLDSMSSLIDQITPLLARARQAADKMPPAVRVAFDDFVAALLVRIAEASGGFLWWGEKISNEEREAARKLLDALGVSVRDPEVRKKFALDASA